MRRYRLTSSACPPARHPQARVRTESRLPIRATSIVDHRPAVPRNTKGTMRCVRAARGGRVGAAMCVALFALAIVGARAQNAGQDVNTDCTCACAASAFVP